MDTTGELEDHKQQVKIQLDTRLKALIKIKKEHRMQLRVHFDCMIAIKTSNKCHTTTSILNSQQVSAEVYTAQIAMSWHKGIYIIRSVLH